MGPISEISHDALTTATPDVVIDAATRVGRIGANAAQPVQFLNDNLRIQTRLLEAAHAIGVDRLLFLGPHASTRAWRRNRSPSLRCSPNHWNPRTTPTPLPR